MSGLETQVSISQPAVDPKLFPLDSEVVFLNHGSFGCCPREVLSFQTELRSNLESQPVQFFQHQMEPLLDEARQALGAFVGANPDDLVFVPNATAGVNTVLRSLKFNPGDQLLVSNHEYNACANALRFAAERHGAEVVTVSIPFPLDSEEEVLEAVRARLNTKTRLLLIDHVTSPTGLILPVAEIVQMCAEHGVDVFIDGAHAPGMIPLNIQELGAAYYTGNCHKWVCAPKSAGFLHVRSDKQVDIRPLTISHGANSPRTDRSRFQIEFAWMGTRDPTAALSVPRALEYMNGLVPGGWPAVMERNRSLALEARKIFCQSFGRPVPCPDSMVGSMASVPLPDSSRDWVPEPPALDDLWQKELLSRCNIEIPIIPWPERPKRLVRMSAQLYNSLPDYHLLGEGIAELMVENI